MGKPWPAEEPIESADTPAQQDGADTEADGTDFDLDTDIA